MVFQRCWTTKECFSLRCCVQRSKCALERERTVHGSTTCGKRRCLRHGLEREDDRKEHGVWEHVCVSRCQYDTPPFRSLSSPPCRAPTTTPWPPYPLYCTFAQPLTLTRAHHSGETPSLTVATGARSSLTDPSPSIALFQLQAAISAMHALFCSAQSLSGHF